jgi:hypothetical protein
MPIAKSRGQVESEIIKLGLSADIGAINKLTGVIRHELNVGPIYSVSDIVINYVNGYCGYLNTHVIKKCLADDINYFSRTINRVNSKLSIDWVNNSDNNIFCHYRYKVKVYVGSLHAGKTYISIDDFWNYFIRHNLDELVFLTDELDVDYLILDKRFTKDNVGEYTHRALMEIRDNIIGDCIDPWPPAR